MLKRKRNYLLSLLSIILTLMITLSGCSYGSRDVSDVSLNENGELVLTYSNGDQKNLGKLAGEIDEELYRICKDAVDAASHLCCSLIGEGKA